MKRLSKIWKALAATKEAYIASLIEADMAALRLKAEATYESLFNQRSSIVAGLQTELSGITSSLMTRFKSITSKL